MKTYRIADIVVGMEVSGRTLAQAKPYEIPEQKPEIIVYAKPELLHERYPYLSMDDCEYLMTGDCFYQRLSFFNGMMLHSSCVVVDEKAYLFSAPSGVGKSTHVKLWLQLLKNKAFVLNDDKPALRFVEDKVLAYGTPWSGTEDYSTNMGVPVGGIAFIKRSEENSIRPITASEAMYYLMDQSIKGWTKDSGDRFYGILERIANGVKFFELSCNMDISAAMLSYATMTGKRLNYED